VELPGRPDLCPSVLLDARSTLHSTVRALSQSR
jgi:hypothetical protein